VPAFSATTLTIPPNQTNFTEDIIHNTRAQFGRPRAEVEAEIQKLMYRALPAQAGQGQPKQQQNTPKPANAQPRAAQAPQQPRSSAPTTPPLVATRPQDGNTAPAGEGTRPKRKRSRSRSRSKRENETPETSTGSRPSTHSAEAGQRENTNDATELRLR